MKEAPWFPYEFLFCVNIASKFKHFFYYESFSGGHDSKANLELGQLCPVALYTSTRSYWHISKSQTSHSL